MVKRKTQVVIDSSDSSSSESENSDLDSELLSLAKKKKMKSSNEKKLKSDSELEEGEVTDSDSSDLSQEEFNDGYGSDLMGDEEDRNRLALMTEKEREQEIFKRIEAREVMKTRFNIEKKLRQAKRRELKKQKQLSDKKTEQPPLDLKERVLERKKTVAENRGKADKKFQAMNMLKARREEKREREEKEKQQKIEQEKLKEEQAANAEKDSAPEESLSSRSHKTKLKASDVYSDDSGSSSDEEEPAPKSKPKKNDVSSSSSSSSSSESDTETRVRNSRVQYISTKEQLSQMRLSRHKIGKIVHLPFFKRVAVGCFVRIMIGANNGKPVYRVGEVTDVCETGKVYQLDTTRTNKGLKLRHGLQERVFRLEYVSNQDFTDNEYIKWRDTCGTQGIALPSVEDMDNKVKDIKEAMTYEFKEEDIEKMVKEKERFKTTPYNFAMKKTQLMKERDMAQAMGDVVRVSELQDELNQLEERATTLDRRRTSTISSISYINDRNRKKNVEEAEKAILAEVKATKGQRADDPFTRRRTKPSMVIKSKRPGDKEEVAPKPPPSAAKPVVPATPAPVEKADKENDTQVKKSNPQKQGEDLYAAHDFDIKIDFDVPSNT